MLYDNVKRLCDEHKISVSALERTLNFPRSSICKWNENEPGIRKVQKVADYFGVSIEKLLESYEEEEMMLMVHFFTMTSLFRKIKLICLEMRLK